MDPHRIRLHGPWQTSISDALAQATAPPLDRIQIPQDWDQLNSVDGAGLVLTRLFGCPSRLDSSQKIWLVIHADSLAAMVRLNEVLIGQIEESDRECRIEIRDRLISRNCLQLELSPSTSAEINVGSSSRWGKLTTVQLEIDETPAAD